jgi:hypothetical protein
MVLASALVTAQPMQTYKAGPGPDELWDVTMKMEVVGLPMALPTQSHKVCVKKDRGGADLIPADSNCKVTDVRTVGNKTTFQMVCTGKDPITGSGEITQGPSSYSGVIRAKSTRKGEEMEMTHTYSGKKVGTCTDQSEQMVASIEKQGRDAVAKQCAAAVDSLSAAVFEGMRGQCDGYRKQFCDKANGVARDMREPAGFSSASKQYGMGLPAAFRMCGQDHGSVTRVACGRGVETRNWTFVASGPCDAEVRAAGDSMCKGRSFTGMDPGIVPLCSRYANLNRGQGGTAVAGSDAAAGRQAAPAQQPAAAQPAAQPPQPQDPVKSGLDAVRKLLPF